MQAARFLVRGRVQGVGFRVSTRRCAIELDLHGFARNLADGRVEVVAQGTPVAIDALEEWLRHGPPLARVDDVHREAAVVADIAGFGCG
jgi:acylphosphatase